MSKRNLLVKLILLKPHLHGRLYGWLWEIVWPLVREADGYVPAQLGAIEMRLDLREAWLKTSIGLAKNFGQCAMPGPG